MKQYLLLLKGKGDLDYSPDELQKRLQEYRKWVQTIQPHYISNNRLKRKGVHIKGKGDVKTDGPFLETKEIIAGFIIIKANNINQATSIAESSPLLNYFEIFVRPMIMKEDF